jgi:hypothetical protein
MRNSPRLSPASLCRTLLIGHLLLLAHPGGAESGDADEALPIFDAHIHYSADVWDAIPPADAIRRLRQAGITRALVSSSGDDGTLALYNADPELVIPVLRPYRQRGTLRTWMHDATVPPYLRERLTGQRYVGIGEFHLQGEEADLPVVREVVQLARQHDLMLHVHADADAIRRIFAQDPDARILWAHAGFEEAAVVRDLMASQANLWADLSFRDEIFADGSVLPEWRSLLTAHADRFLLGVDTYTPQRWLQVQEVVAWQRALLDALPREAALKIAYQNGQRVFGERFAPDRR